MIGVEGGLCHMVNKTPGQVARNGTASVLGSGNLRMKEPEQSG